jgi:phosphotransferase system enzyme I (PtsI)
MNWQRSTHSAGWSSAASMKHDSNTARLEHDAVMSGYMNDLKGLGVSPGIARGEALVLRQRARHRYYLVPASAVEQELERLTQARDTSRAQLEEISARITRLAGAAPASLFEAQILMLDDPMLTARATELIRSQRRNAEWAVQQAGDELSGMFNQADDPYLRERKGDLQDVIGRVRMNLTGESSAAAESSTAGKSVIVADDLPPSVAAQIDWTQTLGFITEVGSWTYHTAILARSLGVPAIVGVRDATERIAPGSEIILDGTTGEVFLDVDDAAEQEILRRRSARAIVAASYDTPRELEPSTRDGVRVRLDANLELADDLSDAVAAGAEGIGLYRSEFLLAGRPAHTVGEAAQTEIYRDLLSRMPGEVTIRTFDTKDVWPRTSGRRRVRPGLRALHVDPEFQKQFETQIRALLRAAHAGHLRILLPFVTGVEDVRAARAIVARLTQQLKADGIAVPNVPVGAMIEVPSAALTAERLTAEADFFSIGTNDLIALTLAADRTDEPAGRLYEPLHPAVLRLLRFVRRAAVRKGRRVSVCGEMSSDPAMLVLMLGLGLTEFSMAPAAIPRARHVIGHVSVEDAARLAREVINLSPEEGRALLQAAVEKAEQSSGAVVK